MDYRKNIHYSDDMETRSFQLREAYRDWLYQYPFSIFATLTFRPRTPGSALIPSFAKERLDEFLRDASKSLKRTLASLGFTVLGPSGHLHSHLLMLDRKGHMPTDGEIAKMQNLWPLHGDLRVIEEIEPVVRYVASSKHLAYPSAVEFYGYGAKALEKTRLLDRTHA